MTLQHAANKHPMMRTQQLHRLHNQRLLNKLLRPTQHKIGHSGDVPQANLLAWYGKTKPNTTKARIHQSKEMYYNTK